MTGAPVPDGADTVVPFEETDEIDRRRAGKSLDEIVIRKALPLGSNVRPAGEDVSAGELVLSAGTVVRPAEAGVMASLGLATARVIRRPVVAVLSTGDELTRTGRIADSGTHLRQQQQQHRRRRDRCRRDSANDGYRAG